MKESSKTLTRKELYDLVWSSPLTKLAKEFSYSDSGLRKICKKHNIPLPKAGYWAKIKYNKKVIKVPLPISKKNQNDEIEIRIDKENNREKSHPNSIIAQLKKEIRNSKEISLNVPDRLSNPDPLIKKVKEDLKNKKVNKWGNTNGLIDSSNGVVNICVAKPNIPRALRFMDTFIKLIKKRGHHIEFNNGTCVVINDEYLKIRFREVSKRVVVNENNWERSELVPSGILSLRLDDGYPEKQWRDSEKPLSSLNY
ncbi:hypothetical protein [Aquimarina algiphila]|nr:hypothetical protein [Aquimarina algiphila]